jgi:cellulose biosynthesis protein BcsQ
LLSCSCVSLSGGQGKSTVTFFLSLLLAAQGKRVLAVDCDPQANLTFYLNHEVAANQPTLLEVLTGAVFTPPHTKIFFSFLRIEAYLKLLTFSVPPVQVLLSSNSDCKKLKSCLITL